MFVAEHNRTYHPSFRVPLSRADISLGLDVTVIQPLSHRVVFYSVRLKSNNAAVFFGLQPEDILELSVVGTSTRFDA